MIVRVEIEVRATHFTIEINDLADRTLGVTDAIAAESLGIAVGRMISALASGSGIPTAIILDQVTESIRRASRTS